jgi:hypothetical protein
MHGRLCRVALALVALGLVVAGAARADERNDKLPCRAAEHHQFDFWIGHWDVFLPNGNKAGENRIESIEGGCALLEQWSGTRGPTGKSLNIYDGLRRVWHHAADPAHHLVAAAGWQRASALGELQGRQDLEHRVRWQVRQEEAALVVRPRPAGPKGPDPLGGREQRQQGGRFTRRVRT